MRKTNMRKFYEQNSRKQWMAALFVVLGMLLWSVIPVSAEIYKWRDENGVIFYSNKPPLDQSRILAIIPSQNLPVLKEEKDGLYYFKFSEEGAPAESEITISAEQLQQLLQEVPPNLDQQAQPSLDMTALTMRLAEVEKALTQEIENRSQWQFEYAQAQSTVKNLKRQNATLRLALARMEDEMKKIQGLVVASDMQAGVANIPKNNQQLAMLEGKVDDMQTHVNTLSQEVGTLHGLALSERVAALSADVQKLEVQQQPDDNLLRRLASLESEVEQLAETLPVSRETTGTVAELAKDGNLLKTVTEYQTQQIGEQQEQILALKDEFAQLKLGIAAIEEQNHSQQSLASELLLAELAVKNQLMEATIKQQTELLKAQDEQMKAIDAKLAQLQGTTIHSGRAIKSAGGITIVPRIERRRSSQMMRLLSWFSIGRRNEKKEMQWPSSVVVLSEE